MAMIEMFGAVQGRAINLEATMVLEGGQSASASPVRCVKAARINPVAHPLGFEDLDRMEGSCPMPPSNDPRLRFLVSETAALQRLAQWTPMKHCGGVAQLCPGLRRIL